ncbi:zinc-finger-containing protein [Rhodoferax antarcticus]|uniref:zinc-finger-containing protein n=1 Tax=Rhodoferax antarcticus TaxID=81479 RepID=UPI00094FCDA2|nr:zinc-finger-containing protein [Rhodoferax antarcticus]
MNELKCPYCFSDIEYFPAERVYKRAGYGFLFVCKGYPACDSYVSASDDAKPMGTLANRYLREQRKRVVHLISEISDRNKTPRQEVMRLIGKVRGVKLFRVGDLREPQTEEILANPNVFAASVEKLLVPAVNQETLVLKLPLRYLYIESHTRPAGALPYQQYRGHLKVLNEAAKNGLVNKVTKRGSRQIFWVLTQAGKTLIDYDTNPHRTLYNA